MDGQTDGQGDSYIPPPLGRRNPVPILPTPHPLGGGLINTKNTISRLGAVALTRYMDGRTDGQTDGRTDRQMDRQTDEQTEGHTDGQTDRRTDGWMN